jgi:hypothetical protein
MIMVFLCGSRKLSEQGFHRRDAEGAEKTKKILHRKGAKDAKKIIFLKPLAVPINPLSHLWERARVRVY